MTAIAEPPAMAVSPPHRRLTPGDLLAVENDGLFELVDRRLVEKQTGADATTVVGQFTGRLWMHTHLTKSGGDVMPE